MTTPNGNHASPRFRFGIGRLVLAVAATAAVFAYAKATAEASVTTDLEGAILAVVTLVAIGLVVAAARRATATQGIVQFGLIGLICWLGMEVAGSRLYRFYLPVLLFLVGAVPLWVRNWAEGSSGRWAGRGRSAARVGVNVGLHLAMLYLYSIVNVIVGNGDIATPTGTTVLPALAPSSPTPPGLLDPFNLPDVPPPVGTRPDEAVRPSPETLYPPLAPSKDASRGEEPPAR